MHKIKKEVVMYLFTSEVVSAGHPDKCADIIADKIVDEFLANDKNARVASEVFIPGNKIIVGGEVKSTYKMSDLHLKNLVLEALVEIGYDGKGGFNNEECLFPKDVEVFNFLNPQSADISQGVDQASGEIGAGDQGIMFGFASVEGKVDCTFMPSAINIARQICNKIYDYARENKNVLGVDIKTQVTIDYKTKANFENCVPQNIYTIVVSAPNVRDMTIKKVHILVQSLIDEALKDNPLYDARNCIVHINPTGRYVNHSPLHDSGLTGRKLIVDSFGGYSPIGGGAQSSKDYTKVDRSGLYAARYIAKNIVASGLAKKCIVQLSYAIGVAKPCSVSIDTMGTCPNVSDDTLSDFVSKNFELTPSWITHRFGLNTPSKETFLYSNLAARGQVGCADYPWEKLEDVPTFKKAFKQ